MQYEIKFRCYPLKLTGFSSANDESPATVKNVSPVKLMADAILWTPRLTVTAAGREKLLAYGIAPPESATSKRALLGKTTVACPRCQSERTVLVSEFGSTACKASYKCEQCLEPFEYFKCI